MSWKIIPQEETRGKSKVEVVCKHLKCFPIEGQGGDVSFGRLKFLLLQILIEDEQGYTLSLKLNASQGVINATFCVQHPPRMERLTITVGEGKRRQKITDVLAPEKKVPGEKEQYDQAGFMNRVQRLAGTDLAGVILMAFAKRLAEEANKPKKKDK